MSRRCQSDRNRAPDTENAPKKGGFPGLEGVGWHREPTQPLTPVTAASGSAALPPPGPPLRSPASPGQRGDGDETLGGGRGAVPGPPPLPGTASAIAITAAGQARASRWLLGTVPTGDGESPGGAGGVRRDAGGEPGSPLPTDGAQPSPASSAAPQALPPPILSRGGGVGLSPSSSPTSQDSPRFTLPVSRFSEQEQPGRRSSQDPAGPSPPHAPRRQREVPAVRLRMERRLFFCLYAKFMVYFCLSCVASPNKHVIPFLADRKPGACRGGSAGEQRAQGRRPAPRRWEHPRGTRGKGPARRHPLGRCSPAGAGWSPGSGGGCGTGGMRGQNQRCAGCPGGDASARRDQGPSANWDWALLTGTSVCPLTGISVC